MQSKQKRQLHVNKQPEINLTLDILCLPANLRYISTYHEVRFSQGVNHNN